MFCIGFFVYGMCKKIFTKFAFGQDNASSLGFIGKIRFCLDLSCGVQSLDAENFKSVGEVDITGEIPLSPPDLY